MKQKFIALVLALVLCCCFYIPVEAANDESFTGSRQLRFYADWSDMNNFINGGRSEFELVLRSGLPAWLDYDVSTQGHDVYYTFHFSFASFEEYQSRMSYLIGRQLATIYSQEDGLLLVENCTNADLLYFLDSKLTSRGHLSERELEEFFHFIDCTLVINGETYQVDHAVSIRPEAQQAILLDDLQITTITNEDDSFQRTITAQLYVAEQDRSILNKLKKQFAQVGKVAQTQLDDRNYQLTVSFTASSREELVESTMLCLDAPSFIAEVQNYLDESAVQVVRTEYFDLTSVLREGGHFTYRFVYPAHWREVMQEEYSCSVVDNSIEAYNTDFIAYSYQRDFQFDTIRIHTDLSKALGKIQRSITFSMPAHIAQYYHDQIVTELEDLLVDGCHLDIYDSEDIRYYSIRFSAWQRKRIEAITKDILNSGKCRLDVSYPWIPFTFGQVTEKIQADGVLETMAPANQIIASYTFASRAKLKAGDGQIQGNTVTFHLRSNDKIHLSFRQFQPLRMLLVLLLAVAVVLLALRLWKKIQTKRKTRPKRICPQCGKVLSRKVEFCGNCGTKYSVPEDT